MMDPGATNGQMPELQIIEASSLSPDLKLLGITFFEGNGFTISGNWEPGISRSWRPGLILSKAQIFTRWGWEQLLVVMPNKESKTAGFSEATSFTFLKVIQYGSLLPDWGCSFACLDFKPSLLPCAWSLSVHGVKPACRWSSYKQLCHVCSICRPRSPTLHLIPRMKRRIFSTYGICTLPQLVM